MATGQETGKEIEVGTYQNLAFDGAWKSRSRAMWGIAFLGLITGAAIGLLAPFFPAIVGAVGFSAAAGHVLETMAIFGATGMATGLVAGGLTGSAAGASASVAKELEIRNLQREGEVEKLLAFPFRSIFLKNPKELMSDISIQKLALCLPVLGRLLAELWLMLSILVLV